MDQQAGQAPPASALAPTPAPADPRSLVAVSEAARLLAEARTLDDVREVRNLAEAARLYARKAHLGLAAQNSAAAISLEAQAKADEIIRAAREAGALATQGQGLPKQLTSSTVSLPTLADLEVSRNEAAAWARVRAVPPEQRAAYVTAASAAGEEVTRAGLLRYAERGRVPDPRADELPPEPADADLYVQPGDLWLLGDHRLLCGDATDPLAVARLLDGEEPRLLATDPPYGVSLDPTWRDAVYNTAGRLGPAAYRAERPYMLRAGPAGQPESEDATRAAGGAHRRTAGHRHTTISGDVRADWSEAFALVPSLQVGYIWHAGVHAAEVALGLERIGFEIVSQIVWDKGLFAIGRSWYHWAHEPCWVARRPGVPNLFIGEHNQSTIWRAPSPKMIMSGSEEEKQDHPAQKPVLLFEIPIRNHLAPGEAVYDPFVGSGTTIIAAESLGRRCYAMELDPRYVQLAKERWERFTGRQAVRG
ncbi:MAG: DNA-methyltransferase [Candidatus Limnocylindrales bacterium]